MVREIRENDLDGLFELYLHLHETKIPEKNQQVLDTWNMILNNPCHHIIINEVDDRIVSACVCVIIYNLTRGVRPYASIENVVTHADYRGHGYASECLQYAKELAINNGCYKLMLITGSQEESTLNFYRNAGYSSEGKTAFVQWIGGHDE